ncbi:MAG: hypothetical protein HOQ05_02210 [Corynebacteriales bacterium]|nr:hypothetical protein [Mycobacteriales bacterium]
MPVEIQPEVTTLSVLGGANPDAYLPYLVDQQASIAAQRCVGSSIVVCDPALLGTIEQRIAPIWADSPASLDLVPARFTHAAEARNIARDRAPTNLIAPVDVDDLFEHPTASQPGGLDLMYLLRIKKGVDVLIGRPRDLIELNGESQVHEPEHARFGKHAGKIITSEDVSKMDDDELPWWLGIVLAPKTMWKWPKQRVSEDLDAMLGALVQHYATAYISGPEDDPHYRYRVTTVGGVTNTTSATAREEARRATTLKWRAKAEQRQVMLRHTAPATANTLASSALPTSENPLLFRSDKGHQKSEGPSTATAPPRNPMPKRPRDNPHRNW